MTSPEPWPRVAVVGAGAVGGYFGGLLARAGAPVVMIGRPAFVEAVKKNGLFLDTLHFQESVRVEASTDLSAIRGAEIVLFCVKTTDNAATARAIAPLLAPNALVLSFQNGVDNVEQIRVAAPIEALPTVVYVAASVPEPGRVKHVGRGDLIFGPRNEKTERVANLFSRANVPCKISENIAGELWTKLIWNCALNAVSALGREKYGKIAASADARKVVETLVDEVLAAGRGAGRAHARQPRALCTCKTCRGALVIRFKNKFVNGRCGDEMECARWLPVPPSILVLRRAGISTG